jgi:hypothetical protein
MGFENSSSSILPVSSPESAPTIDEVIIKSFGGDSEVGLDETLESKYQYQNER